MIRAHTSAMRMRSTKAPRGTGIALRCPTRFPCAFAAPHCHTAIELEEERGVTDLECPSCGSQFSLAVAETASFPSGGSKTMAQFQLITQVGMGQFGSVCKARYTQLDRIVAVKVPRKGQLDATGTQQFQREARATAQIRHPNIVSVYEVGKHEDSLYIVSDFVEGITLADWLTGYQPSPREAAGLCVKITEMTTWGGFSHHPVFSPSVICRRSRTRTPIFPL